MLYDYIVPFFQGLPFQTRKLVDLQLWVVAVKLHKLGYIYETAGRNLLIAIASSINDNRYSTNPKGPATAPTPEEIDKVLSVEPPFNIKNGDSHHKLSRQITLEKGGRRGFTVYVYKDGVQIEGSPFSTYGAADRAIGLRSNSRTISRNIDTGKLYKNTYLFTSTWASAALWALPTKAVFSERKNRAGSASPGKERLIGTRYIFDHERRKLRMVNQILTCKCSFFLLYFCLCSYWKRVVLRFI